MSKLEDTGFPSRLRNPASLPLSVPQFPQLQNESPPRGGGSGCRCDPSMFAFFLPMPCPRRPVLPSLGPAQPCAPRPSPVGLQPPGPASSPGAPAQGSVGPGTHASVCHRLLPLRLAPDSGWTLGHGERVDAKAPWPALPDSPGIGVCGAKLRGLGRGPGRPSQWPWPPRPGAPYGCRVEATLIWGLPPELAVGSWVTSP